MSEEFIERSFDNFNNLRWLDTYMIGHKGFIAGGCFKNIFNNEKVKDIDIFFETKSDYIDAVCYYESSEEFELYYENKKVVAYKRKNHDCYIELISSVFGTPEQIISDFDFSVTKFAYYKEEYEEDGESGIEYKIIHHKDFFEHLHMKRLVVNKDIKYPFGTFERILRYAKYGYFPCKETKLNIIKAIKESETTDVDRLSESLYDGVD